MNPTAAFESFARQEIDADDVFRVLVGHGGFLAPPLEALRGVVSPPGELWVYTDRAAVARATVGGANVGPLVTGMSGIDLFGAIPGDMTAVRVNPVSPPAMGWNVPAEAFPLAQAWVNALRFEAELTQWAAAGAVSQDQGFETLLSYRHYLCYLAPDNAVLTIPGRDGFDNPAVACTAPDCGRRVLGRVPEPLRSGLRPVFVPGAELLEKLPEQGVDGVILNPAGPGPTLPVRLVAK